MAKLVYSTIQSLDGYSADAAGSFDWAEPDESLHTFINELERPVSTYLFGRRMYDVMVAWETMGGHGDEPPYIEDYAQMWRAATKIVYSKGLATVASARTRIERSFDPVAIRRLKEEVLGDIAIGGPTLAAQAISDGLVDEYQLFVVPIIVGGGTRSLPKGLQLNLELVDERRFDNGVVYLNYRAVT